ncbi:twin-arginine translocation signal domain-containing protein [Natronorubrum thiooxidans]|uniref:Uncharacterized protein n=1 Tax=Natronorubrum thiooxidans TaxID=308853 RepID=A0A1N7EVI0_9EURY|nr:twin-arginine translocation signal domain-containing protein [Natronorubrum thiooxidans]SIR91945.1 hypothetical protein SAMN05421752_10580 [Natronorubrum thiooxidans]
MSGNLSRRRILKATAVSGIAVSTAGCTGSLLGDSACDTGEDFVVALYDEDFEAAASYYPHEYTDEVDKDEIASQYEALFSMGEFGELEDISCECSESVDDEEIDEANEDEDFDGEVDDIKELRYEITTTEDGEETTDSGYVMGIEIDGDWYAVFASEADFDHCTADE